jgi:hypothetical protein
MNKKKTFLVNIDLSITDNTQSYDNVTTARFDLTEAVPPGVEPKDHLQALIRANFARVFGSIQLLEQSDDVV